MKQGNRWQSSVSLTSVSGLTCIAGCAFMLQKVTFCLAFRVFLRSVSWPFTTRNMAVYSTKSGLLRRRLPPFGTFAASFSCTLCLPWGVTPLLPATYDCTRYFRSYASLCHDFSGDALQELQAKSKRKQNGLIGTSVHVPTMWAITVAPSLWHVCQDPRPCFKNCFLVPVRDSCGVRTEC